MTRTKVQSELIATNAISGTIIADGAITSTHLAANCVDSSELVTGSIDTIHIAANQVTATKIVTNGVLTRHISDDQVTAAKLANSINTDIATGVTANTTANAALPKAGGTMTGNLTAPNLIASTSVYSNNGVYYGATTLDLKDSSAASFLSFASNKNATFAGTITVNQNINSSTGNPLVLTGDGGANIELYSNGNAYFDATQLHLRGTNGSGSGALAIAGTTVIDSNRNLTYIGTISSGAITSTGNIKTDYNDTISMDYASSSGAYHKGMSGTSFASGSTARGLHIFNYDNDSNLGINFWGGTNASKQLHATFDSKGNLRIGDQSTDLTGAKTSRSIVQVGVSRLTVGSAGSMCMAIYDVNTELSHTAGSAVSDAKGSKGTVWRSTSGQIYGPYIDLPRGQYRLSYRVKCNDNTSYENAMRLLVYSIDSGTVHTRVTERFVTCREFENTTDYQTFSIDFDVNVDMGNNFEIYGFPQNSNQIDWDYVMITPETDSYSQRQRGIITKPNQPYFEAYRNGNQTGYNASGNYAAVVVYNSATHNVGGHYNTSTGYFTAPVAGIYCFTAAAYCNFSAGQSWFSSTSGRINATDTVYSAGKGFPECHTILKLGVGDTVGYHPYKDSMTNGTINANSNHTYFKGYLMG